MELILSVASGSTYAAFASEGTITWLCAPVDPKEHTRQMLPALLAGMRSMSASFDDLRLVTVTLGPGPFNGLRVAISAAKGLNAGTGVALVGISTLEAEANRCPHDIGAVRPVLGAGRAGLTTALFTAHGGEWEQTQEPLHVNAADAGDVLNRDVQVCGELDEQLKSALPAEVWDGLRIAPTTRTRLDVLAAMGWKRYSAGNTTQAGSMQPLYARPPHITIPRDRRT